MKKITNISRDLRNNLTIAEKCLWVDIRNKKLGVKFRRQHPIIYFLNRQTCFFIADFASLERRLIIEVDGKIHDNQIERDKARDYIILNEGWNIIRLSNETILHQTQLALQIIKSNL